MQTHLKHQSKMAMKVCRLNYFTRFGFSFISSWKSKLLPKNGSVFLNSKIFYSSKFLINRNFTTFFFRFLSQGKGDRGKEMRFLKFFTERFYCWYAFKKLHIICMIKITDIIFLLICFS